MNDNLAFNNWMDEVDRTLLIKHKITTSSLPDCLYRDWYDYGMSTSRAANIAWLNYLVFREEIEEFNESV